jgi:hypothetical protein
MSSSPSWGDTLIEHLDADEFIEHQEWGTKSVDKINVSVIMQIRRNTAGNLAKGGVEMKMKWYGRSIYALVALALVLSLGIVAAPMTGTVEASPGTDYYVATTGNDANGGSNWTDAWKHISYAAANVPAGTSPTDPNVIHVAAGHYDTTNNGETFPITFNSDNVRVIGAGPGNSIIDAEDAEVNVIEIGTDSVDISGFTIRNAKGRWWYLDGKGIYMDGATNCDISNIEIYNIAGVTSGDGSWEAWGIFAYNGSHRNTFSSIEIYNITSPKVARGIGVYDSEGNTFDGINIHDLSITGCYSDNVVFGIHMWAASNSNHFDSIEIHDLTGGDWAEGIELQESNFNTFGDLSISDVTATYHAYGIKLGESSGNTFGSSSEIWNISAPDGAGLAIGIGVEKDPSLGSNNNTFRSFDIHDTEYGFYIHDSNNTYITKSNIHDNVVGVNISSNISASAGNKLNCTNIEDNTEFGVYKQWPPDVDATGNWWGDANGPSLSPGTGDKISLNVLYVPWLPSQFEYCEECGGTPPSHPPRVPAVNHWGIIAMITLFAGLLVWTVRRKRLAS